MTTPCPELFEAKDSAMITLALGTSAQNLRELRDGVAQAPIASIYHHYFHTLLRHTFDDPEYRNDFALWARRQLHDFHLAERFDVIDPVDYDDIEDLRRHLLDVIDGRLHELSYVPAAAPGRQFHFLRSQLVVFATGLSAATPSDLAALVPRLPAGSIFFHFVEARRRHPLKRDDFSAWLESWGPETDSTRQRLEQVDFYLWTLTEMRDLIVRCLDSPQAEARQR